MEHVVCQAQMRTVYNSGLFFPFSDVEPYSMQSPLRVRAQVVGPSTVDVTWYDPELHADQRVTDARYYTVRYYSFSVGQYNYINSTSLTARMTGLRPDTEYQFSVRSNNGPFLSRWSDDVTATTSTNGRIT